MKENENGTDALYDDSGDNHDDLDELLEPKFNFERILNDLAVKFRQDSASCISVHDKFLAIGTQRGFIYVLDHDGHIHSSSHSHRCAVGGIAIDKPGNYVISCANDSQISILGFGSSEYNQNSFLTCSAKCIAISEDYSRPNSGHRYITGDTNITLHEKGLIKGKETKLYTGFERDGLITHVSWNGDYVAFTNDTGTRVFDTTLGKIITLVKPIHDVKMMPSSKFRPTHSWLDNDTFAVAWANTVCVCSIVATTTPARVPSTFSKTAQLYEKKGTLIHLWKSMPVHIAGISFTVDENYLWKDIVLFGIKTDDEHSYPGDDTASFCSSRLSTEGTLSEVVLQVLEPISIDEYEGVTEDIIEMHGSSRLTLAKFQLGAVPTDSTFFLLASKELIRAQPCSVDDHVKWCLENERYEDALYHAREHPNQLEEFSVLEIGKKFIDHLISLGQFEKAVQLIPEVCSIYKEEWEYYANEFEQQKKTLLLARYLPTENPQLEPEVYEWVLTASLFTSVKLFKHFVTTWNADIYRVGAIIDLTYKRYHSVKGVPDCKPLTDEDRAALLVSLAHLYTYERKYDKALKIYMGLSDKAVFPLIEKYRLFDQVKDKTVDLMNIDQQKALRLLLDNEDSMPSSDVMRQLSREPRLQMLYLNRLFSRNEGLEHSDLAISLYAEYDRSKLMPFLTKHTTYQINRALAVCEGKKYMEETVFLLGRAGKRMKAVEVMVEDMGRMGKAIEFCKDYETDTELWNYLIELALRTPEHITQLLTTSGLSIDPLQIIEKIPSQMDIPGLRDSLVRILQDNDDQVKLQLGYQEITHNDFCILFDNYISELTGTVILSEFTECAVCSCLLFDQENVTEEEPSALKTFGCGHIAHKHCCDDFYKNNDNLDECAMRVNRSLSFAGELAGGVCPVCSNDVSGETG